MKPKVFDWESIAIVFEERAEHLSKDQLIDYTYFGHEDLQKIVKIKGPGAKLIIGPRGSGKSTLLRSAYFQILESEDIIGAYVNYGKSLSLEPLMHQRSDAVAIFRQWLLQKIVIGLYEYHNTKGQADQLAILRPLNDYAVKFTQKMEFNEELEDKTGFLTASKILNLLEVLIDKVSAKRCVLLFDDAAHAFSVEQQREFFEVFRELKSRRVAVKAAVYPGITSYSHNFHLGHDAEMIEVWTDVDEDDYIDNMKEIFRKRIPAEIQHMFSESDNYLELIAYASFGIPRGFLNILADTVDLDKNDIKKPTRNEVLKAISRHAENSRDLFNSLRSKLPRYKNFIDIGKDTEDRIVSLLREYNRTQDITRKSVTCAIKEPYDNELDRILKFMEYAGLLRRRQNVSRGVKGVFQRYTLHYSLVISENVLSLGRSFAVSDIVKALQVRHPHSFTRTNSNKLLSQENRLRCILDLPPCPNCSAARVSETQRFCINCGKPLPQSSVYHDLLQTPIEVLPITSLKIKRLKETGRFKVIQDILLDSDQDLINVPSVGRYWANKIKTEAEEFINV